MMIRPGSELHLAEDDGFTVAEVVVALALFMVLSASLGLSLIAILDTSRGNESRVIAANLVAKKIETLRGTDVASIGLGDLPAETVAVEGKNYYLNVRTALNTTGGVGSACDGAVGTSAAAFKQIHVEATWDKMGGVEPVRSDTTRSLPISGLSGTTGVVTVPVKDAAGKPVPGQQVTLSNATTSWVATTQFDGCAVFNNLAPGSAYGVKLSTPGWVDQNQTQAVARGPVQVMANSITKDPGFVYDRASAVQLTLTRPAGADASFRIPPALGVTLNSSFAAAQPYPVCGSGKCSTVSGDTRQVTPLFPFVGGYTAWAGTCSSAQPTTLNPVAMKAGQTSTASVMLGAGRIQVKDSTGVVQTGWTLKAINAQTGCAEAFDLGTSATAPTALALPQGQWMIVATLGTTTRQATLNVVSGQISNAGQPIVVTV